MKQNFTHGAALLLFSFFILALFSFGCNKQPDLTEEEKLPAVTQEGKGTFGCLLNGEVWIPKSGGLLQPGIEPVYNEITGQFGISAIKYLSDTNQSITFGTKPVGVFVPVELILQDSNALFIDIASSCGLSTFNASHYWSIKGSISLSKIDKVLGIISGTFLFDLYNEKCQDTIKITKGRFDIKYK